MPNKYYIVETSGGKKEEVSTSGCVAVLQARLNSYTASVILGGSMNDNHSHTNLTQLTTDCANTKILLQGELCKLNQYNQPFMARRLLSYH